MPGLFPLSLEQRTPGRIRPSLDRLTHALDRLGRPQTWFQSVLVVGTNGKGSTAAMLERILAAGGSDTGLYTSPHLRRVNERIRVGRNEIGDDDLERLVTRLEAFPDLTYFETLTAAAFLHFAERGVEVAVLEAGMGGRWDATRVARSRIAGLTNVGTDHRHWLGDDQKEIARDKGDALAAASAGVFSADVPPSVMDDLGLRHAAPARRTVDVGDFAADGRLPARWDECDWRTFHLPLAGRHQGSNFQLAVALALNCRDFGWTGSVTGDRVAAALADVVWPGRLSSAVMGTRSVLLDGAHNIEAAACLAEHLRGLGTRHHLLFSCLEDKPVEAMAALLRPVVGDVAVCPLADPRAMCVQRMRDAFPGAAVWPDPLTALANLPEPVVATGSLRLIGCLLEVR